MDNVDRWINHSRMSDPACHAVAIADLPSEVGLLNGIIQGLLVHADWLPQYGLDQTQFHANSRTTLSVADRLGDVLNRDVRPLDARRPPHARAIGTCRDFALMLCAMLRCQDVPARLRCGFASYFGSGWEDHWVCEYWDRHTQTWRLSDPQIDELLKDRCRITFNPSDLPRQSFVTAGRAWLDCRAERSNAERFGHGQVTGLWFVKVNVFRDHYALNGRETSTWDGWRDAPAPKRVVHERDAALLDRIATCPEQRIVEVSPDWLV